MKTGKPMRQQFVTISTAQPSREKMLQRKAVTALERHRIDHANNTYSLEIKGQPDTSPLALYRLISFLPMDTIRTTHEKKLWVSLRFEGIENRDHLERACDQLWSELKKDFPLEEILVVPHKYFQKMRYNASLYVYL